MAKKKVQSVPSSRVRRTISFEQALAQLEQTVARLEDGQLGLDESLAQYEQGIKYLQAVLSAAGTCTAKDRTAGGCRRAGDRCGASRLMRRKCRWKQKQASRSRRRSRRRRSRPAMTTRPRCGMDDSGTLF